MRGHRILQQTLKQLALANGLAAASEVLVSGDSAGGLSTFLHVDEVAAFFPKARVSGLPDSGFFVDMPDVGDNWHIRSQFTYIYSMQNASHGVNQKCVAAHAPRFADKSKTWPCMFAQYTYPFIKANMYILNPLADSWQLVFVAAPLYDANYWNGCNPSSFKGCSLDRIAIVADMYSATLDALKEAQVQNGFFTGCVTHVIGISVCLPRIPPPFPSSLTMVVAKYVEQHEDRRFDSASGGGGVVCGLLVGIGAL